MGRQILLIWNEVPEDIEVYLVPESHPLATEILECHGLLVNSEEGQDNENLTKLNYALCDENGVNSLEEFLVYSSRPEKGKEERPYFIGGVVISTIVSSGFIL